MISRKAALFGRVAAAGLASLLATGLSADNDFDLKWYQGTLCRPLAFNADVVAIAGTLYNKSTSAIMVTCPLPRDHIYSPTFAIITFVDAHPTSNPLCVSNKGTDGAKAITTQYGNRYLIDVTAPATKHLDLRCLIPGQVNNKPSGIRAIALWIHL